MPAPWNCSIIIPVYNAENTLPALVSQLADVLPSFCSEYEVILVNDGSRDGTAGLMRDLAAQYAWVKPIHLMRNYGQHNALLCGVRSACQEIIVTMDDDLQHPPGEIRKLLEKLDEGFDAVYGPPEKEQHGLWRDLASQLTKLVLQSTMGADTARQVSAFRAFRTVVRDSFRDYQNMYVNLDVLLTWGTDRFSTASVHHDPRMAGISHYTIRKLLVHAINMVTGFSVLPLQVASWTGFIFALFGALVLVYVIGRFLIQGGSVPGFPFLASTIAIFSGVQLFALGIIGEYLARMHFRLMDRPPYVIRQINDKGIK